MAGWVGRILRVDLTTGAIEARALNEQAARDYIGGRGLGIWILNREMDPTADPLSPENILVLAAGPLTGTKAATGSRYMVVTKSPLSGALTCSNSGGMFPTHLKRAGFDAVVFTGRAKSPKYLYIENGAAQLRPADHLWGKTTHEATDLIRKETDSGVRVSCIGPAGEKKVLIAAVINDKHRAAGRSGVGAVMGSKNLKAVAVKGTGKIALADPEGFNAFHKSLMDRFTAETTANPPAIRTYGTAYGVGFMNEVGILPTKNFQFGRFDQWEKVSGPVLKENYLVRSKPCFSCPIGCGRVTRLTDGHTGEGPEYETIYAMGPNCLVSDFAAVIKANFLCNELGMDTISMGNAVAVAMELYEMGVLTKDRAGRTVEWGDGKALVELTRMTGFRQGFGDLMARGSYRLAEHFGHPELSMGAKKHEFAGYDPRGEQGMGLAYATSPIGGSHMRGDPAYFEVFGVWGKVDPLVWEGKARLVKNAQDLSCVIDSAGVCIFFASRYLVEPKPDVPPKGLLTYMNTATGAGYSLEELQAAGERIFNAERAFLVKAGFSAKDDTLPPRMTRSPMPGGPAKGHVCHLDEMKAEYYPLRGWDKDGRPEKKTLKRLGL